MIIFTKINLFAPNPKACLTGRQGSKLIFNTPGTCPDKGGRAGADVENQKPV